MRIKFTFPGQDAQFGRVLGFQGDYLVIKLDDGREFTAKPKELEVVGQ